MKFTTGVALRTSDGSMLGGDMAAIDEGEAGLGVMVIDVAGNGWTAAREAWRVRSDVEAAVRLEPTAALRRIDDVMSGGRGAVGIAARFEPQGRMRYAAVGDVRAERWRSGQSESLRVRSGQLGGVCPTLTETTDVIEPGDVYVFVTDGIRTGMTLPTSAGPTGRAPDDLAARIVTSGAREHDDATCLVVAVGR